MVQMNSRLFSTTRYMPLLEMQGIDFEALMATKRFCDAIDQERLSTSLANSYSSYLEQLNSLINITLAQLDADGNLNCGNENLGFFLECLKKMETLEKAFDSLSPVNNNIVDR
jgi:hypothetical protein